MIDNITLYRMFYEVAKQGSISEAAQHLYITQPAVSSAVKQLESMLGVSLFFRTNRGIRMTPEGELLYSYVKAALESLEAGEEMLRDISGLNQGILRVGASDMTLRFYLLEYLAVFHQKYPHVKLSVTNAPTPKTLEALQKGDIDFGVITEPIDAIPDVKMIPVREIRDIVITGDDKYGDIPQSYEDLAEQKLIMLERGTSTRRYIENQLKENGAPDFMLDPDIELGTSDLIIDFVKQGIGCAFIEEDFAKEGLKAGSLHEVKLIHPFKPRHFLLAYHKKVPLTAAAKSFMELLKLDGKD